MDEGLGFHESFDLVPLGFYLEVLVTFRLAFKEGRSGQKGLVFDREIERIP